MNARLKQGQKPSRVPWDSSEHLNLTEREGHVRDTVIYLTGALVQWMDETWGGSFTHITLTTDATTGHVTVGRAEPGDEFAVHIRRIESIQWAEFSFWRPLHQLQLKVHPTRQFEVRPFLRQQPDGTAAFVFPLFERKDMPRDTREAELVAQAARRPISLAAPSREGEEHP